MKPDKVWMKTLVRFLVFLAGTAFLLWGGATSFLYFNQTAIIFPVPPVKSMPSGNGFEPLALSTTDGETLNLAIHRAEPGESWVIAFHGNGGDVVQLLPEASVFAEAGFGVLIAEYRGYNGSSGTPSMKGLYADALAAFDHLRSFTNRPIHLYAHSLGTAMAVHVAENREADGMALLSPFDSVLAVAQARYRVLTIRPLLHHPFPSIEKIASLDEPIIIYHGDQDRVVPINHGLALYAAAPQGTEFVTIEGAGHNDMFARGVTARAAAFFSELDDR